MHCHMLYYFHNTPYALACAGIRIWGSFERACGRKVYFVCAHCMCKLCSGPCHFKIIIKYSVDSHTCAPYQQTLCGAYAKLGALQSLETHTHTHMPSKMLYAISRRCSLSRTELGEQPTNTNIRLHNILATHAFVSRYDTHIL